MPKPFKEKKPKKRFRNWACLIYPDSQDLKENWRQIISDACVNAFLSPLHDKDVYESDLPEDDPESGDFKHKAGDLKKPHYHLLVCYEGVKTYEQVKTFFESFGGVGCKVMDSKVGAARYLCHMDHPDKARYSEEDVTSFGHEDYLDVIMGVRDWDALMVEIETWCLSHSCFTYAQLKLYCNQYHQLWAKCVSSHSIHFTAFLKSLKYSVEHFSELNNLSCVDDDGVLLLNIDFDHKDDNIISNLKSDLSLSPDSPAGTSPFADPDLGALPDIPLGASKEPPKL